MPLAGSRQEGNGCHETQRGARRNRIGFAGLLASACRLLSGAELRDQAGAAVQERVDICWPPGYQRDGAAVHAGLRALLHHGLVECPEHDRDAGRLTPCLGAQTRQLVHVFFKVKVDGQVREPREPLIAVFHGTAEPGGAVASHQDRRMRGLEGPYLRHGREAGEAAVELRLRLRPQFLHREHLLAHDLPAQGRVDAVIAEQQVIPASGDAEQEAAPGQT